MMRRSWILFVLLPALATAQAPPPIKALPPTMVLPQPAPGATPAVVIDAPSALSSADKLKIVGSGSPRGVPGPIGVDTWQVLSADRPSVARQAWLEVNGRVFWNAHEGEVAFGANVVQDNYVQVSFYPTPNARYVVTFYLSILSESRPLDSYSFILYGGNGRETIEVPLGSRRRKSITTILQAGPSTAAIGAMLTSFIPGVREAPWVLHSVEISQIR
jgi:hypothetical protein